LIPPGFADSDSEDGSTTSSSPPNPGAFVISVFGAVVRPIEQFVGGVVDDIEQAASSVWSEAKDIVDDVGRAVSSLDSIRDDMTFALHEAEGALVAVENETRALVSDAERGVHNVVDDGVREAAAALKTFEKVGRGILVDSQKMERDLVHSAEWLGYQAANLGLAVVKDAKQGLDLAEEALKHISTLVENVAILIAENVLKGILEVVDVEEIVLAGSLGGRMGGDAFEAAVKVRFMGKLYQPTLDLDLRDTTSFILQIFQMWVYICIWMPSSWLISHTGSGVMLKRLRSNFFSSLGRSDLLFLCKT
jgi:hypothetical protein